MPSLRLASLTVQNFQYWDHFELDLTDPRSAEPYSSVAIFGEQGSGKSTLMRAFRWLAYGDLGMGAERTYPQRWKGRQRADQVVRAKFLRTATRGSQMITLERRKVVGERQSRIAAEVQGGSRLEGKDAEPLWENLVGRKPKAHEGALWMIRRDEMQRIHRSLTDAEGQGYLLQFYNQSALLNKLESGRDALSDEFDKLLEKSQGVESLGQEYRSLKDRAESKRTERDEKIKERDRFDGLIEQNQLSEQEKQIVDNALKVVHLSAEEASARVQLSNAYLGKDRLREVTESILASCLAHKGLDGDIPRDTLPDEYKWDEISQKLEALISAESLEAIRRLAAQSRGLDLSALRQAIPLLEMRLDMVEGLQRANRQALKLKADLRAHGAHNVTSQAVEKLETKDGVFKAAVRGAGEARTQLEGIEAELRNLEDLRDKAADRLAGADKANSTLEPTRQAHEAAKLLIKCLENAESQYRKDMFNNAIARLVKYWEETSASDVYAPALSAHDNTIVLRKQDTGEEFAIRLEDQGQGPSSGESEQLLVCMAMALAEQAQVHMPLVLDDVHTKMDNQTRPSVFRIATKFADQVIFVTNDENKLAEMNPFIQVVVRLRKAKLTEEPHDSREFELITEIERLEG